MADTVTFVLRLRPELVSWLDEQCVRDNKSRSAWVSGLLLRLAQSSEEPLAGGGELVAKRVGRSRDGVVRFEAKAEDAGDFRAGGDLPVGRPGSRLGDPMKRK